MKKVRGRDEMAEVADSEVAGPRRSALRLGIVGAVAVVELVWLGWVLVQPLPDVAASGRELRRSMLLWRALPEVVPGVSWSESFAGQAVKNLSQPGNLGDRLPILAAAGLIAAAAVAIGDGVLRWVRVGPGRGERLEWVAMAYGLGAAVLGALTLVAGRAGALGVWPVRLGLGAVVAGGIVGWGVRWRRGQGDSGEAEAGVAGGSRGGGWRWLPVVVGGPLVGLMVLGALQPTIEFDSLEYHLQAPKEYFVAGRIEFLPHNVYAAMPQGVEMLHLLGMEALGDWWTGALAGQVLVSVFAAATAVVVWATARRVWEGAAIAGAVAAVVYVTTPWVFRLATTPLVEGPLAFYHAALVGVAVRPGMSGGDPSRRSVTNRDREWLLAGLLAGGAFACKYPALVTAVIPAGLLAVGAGWRSKRVGPVAALAVGVLVLSGPWLVKNVVDTGNPVYPLGYEVFGGREWSTARERQWASAHGPRPIDGEAIGRAVLQVAGRSDWQSPLYAALVPLGLLAPRAVRRRLGALAVYAGYLLVSWFVLTHRLDRFWVPVLPVLAVLAGSGGASLSRFGGRAGRVVLGVVLAVGMAPLVVLVTTDLCGPVRWTERLEVLRSEVPAEVNGPLARLDEGLPAGSRALLVGVAAVFPMRSEVVYNTVFDEDHLTRLAAGRTAAEVGRALESEGITHVYVDWAEIERYRRSGNYGFSAFVRPEVFAGLVGAGVLEPAERLGPNHELYRVR